MHKGYFLENYLFCFYVFYFNFNSSMLRLVQTLLHIMDMTILKFVQFINIKAMSLYQQIIYLARGMS